MGGATAILDGDRPGEPGPAEPAQTPESKTERAGLDEPALAALRARTMGAIAHIDRMMGELLDAILHHPDFQRLEGLWRGTHWLVAGVEDPMVKVRILDIRWLDISRDLERAMDFDQSQLFRLVYSEEFGMAGGEPFGIMLIDHAVSHRLGQGRKTDDVAILEGLTDVAAAAFCPFIVAVDPTVAAMDGFDEIDLRQDLEATFADPSFSRWNRLRQRADARFLGAVMPRLLGRLPHEGRAHPRLGFVYDEQIKATSDLLWISGGFGLAHVAARAMARSRWPAAIRGTLPPGEGGTVDGPVRAMLPGDRRGVVARFAVENAISEAQEVVLNEYGIIALRQMHLTGMAAFLNLPSLHRPPLYDGEAARMNAKMCAMLNYVMCVSRFAHYVKVMARDWVGKYTDADACERLLQSWLDNYVTGDDDASPSTRLRYPLREARVTVNEVPGKPGIYGCEIAIRPHYQLDQITSEFRLTTMVGKEGGDLMVKTITQSLIDRLLDDEPEKTVEMPESEQDAIAHYKLGLRRDLEQLLNSKRPLLAAFEEHDELKRSVIAFGLDDLSTEDFSSAGARERIRRMVSQCIRDQEPRLSNVQVDMDESPTSRGIRFRITALLTLIRDQEAVIYDANINPSDRVIAVELTG